MLIPRSKTLLQVAMILAIALVSAVAARAANTSTVTFLGKSYRLGYFHAGPHSMWEFTTGKETVDNWTTLVTVIDRADAKSPADLDRLAEGLVTAYKNSGAIILATKSFRDKFGKPYDNIVLAFNEPDKHRIELNYVKTALGKNNAYVLIYAVRVYGPGDYRKAAASFVDNHSQQIGEAFDAAPVPDVDGFPRKSP